MKKSRVLLIGVVILSLTLMSSLVFADQGMKKIEVVFNGVNILVNDERVEADNITYKGTTYVPLRAISEMLGMDVGWDGETNTASINDTINDDVDTANNTKPKFSTRTKEKIDLIFNGINILVNDQRVEADNIAYKGTTYVPLRAISEMLGKDVGWDGETNTASIDDFSDVSTQEDNSDENIEAPAEDIANVGLRVRAGESARASIKGTPNSTYSISVMYSSGPSKAKGLEAKNADSNGDVSWTWKVGSKTKPGKYRVIIRGDKIEELELEVLE